MSEVQDACQIIMVTGKGAYYLGKITAESAMMIMKVMNTIYLSKWNGVTTLNRFRAIKGDEFLFVNIATENRFDLQGIYKEMQDHGILLAELPDLCGGDGRTQVVISPSDAAKFKAFLLDHSDGRYQDIKVGQISAEDYARSGYDSQNEETPELSDLTDSAKDSLAREKQLKERRPAGLLTMLGTRFGRRQSASGQEESRRQSAPGQEESRRQSAPGQEELNQQEQGRLFQPVSPAVLYQLEKHDEQVRGDKTVTWLTDPPIKKHDNWSMYEMPDGVHAVVIPNQDRYEFPSQDGGLLYRAALHEDRTYNMINLATGEMNLVNGAKVASELDRPDFKMENAELKNLRQNLQVTELVPEEENLAAELFTTLNFTPRNAFDSGLIDGPYTMRIPDAYEKNGFQYIDFYKSDCRTLPDGSTMEIKIPASRSKTGGTEFIKVDRDFSNESLTFGIPDEKGVTLSLPGEARGDPDFKVHFEKPCYDRASSGQRLEIHIDPAKTFQAQIGGSQMDARQEPITGKDILKQYNLAVVKAQAEGISSASQENPAKHTVPLEPEITRSSGR